MQLFDTISEHRNGKRKNTAKTNSNNESVGPEENSAPNLQEIGENEGHEIRTSTQ